jgi:hypothetical protein
LFLDGPGGGGTEQRAYVIPQARRRGPSHADLAALRASIGAEFNLSAAEACDPPTAGRWHASLLAAVSVAAEDPDKPLLEWLREGAPMGISRPIAPGGLFPPRAPEPTLAEQDIRSTFAYAGNHGSFHDLHGAAEAPALSELRGFIEKGYALQYPDRAAAEAVHGPLHLAPLGAVRKERAGVVKTRVIQDLLINGVNSLSSFTERVVLPRGIDHAVDMAVLSDRHPGAVVHCLVLDFVDAFMSMALHPDEMRFTAAEVPETSGLGPILVWRVVGFGGRVFPLVYSRAASFAARTAQAAVDVNIARLQLYVDDPVLAVAGSRAQAALECDVVVAWWLALGLELAWHKGAYATGCHDWIGIGFYRDESSVVMRLPHAYLSDTRAALLPLCASSGSVPLKVAHSAVGKASRIAQIAPVASPFVASLWGALTGALQANTAERREAPPGHASCARFSWAARWFVALLDGRPAVQLTRRVYSLSPVSRLGLGHAEVQFDASPWGGGAVLVCRASGVPLEFFNCLWTQPLLSFFRATTGDPAFQSLWEFITLYMALLVWAPAFPSSVLLLKGDNTGSLADAIALKGGRLMNVVARELSLRVAWQEWQYAVEHLPSERNTLADALSRLSAIPPLPFSTHPCDLPPPRRSKTGVVSEPGAAAACMNTVLYPYLGHLLVLTYALAFALSASLKGRDEACCEFARLWAPGL